MQTGLTHGFNGFNRGTVSLVTTVPGEHRQGPPGMPQRAAQRSRNIA